MGDKLTEQIKADREAGTPGPWRIHDCESYGDRCKTFFKEVWNDETDILVTTEVTRAHNDGGTANMRRIARVPDMEARILADADRIRELEAQVGRVTVRPLVWRDARFCNLPREEANSLLGYYEVLQRLYGDFGGSVPSEDPEQSGAEFGGASSMEAAKAAAQADYERRIMSALSPAPVTVSEAARVLIERIPCDEDAIAKVQCYARFADFIAALCAIQENDDE